MFFKILYVLTIVLEIVFVPLFLKYYWPDKCKKSLMYKMICATLFIICGYCAMKIGGNNTPYATLMMWGFVFGWLGDLLLHSLSGKMLHFAIGVVSFLVGHIFFITAFYKAFDTTYPQEPVFRWYEFAIIAVIVIAVAIYAYFKELFKKKAVITSALLLYGAFLFMMFIKAIKYCVGEWAYGTNDNMVLTFVTVLGGAFMFVVSDVLLGYIIAFDKKNRAMRIINIVTYFMAQVLLASSLIVVKSAIPLY